MNTNQEEGLPTPAEPIEVTQNHPAPTEDIPEIDLSTEPAPAAEPVTAPVEDDIPVMEDPSDNDDVMTEAVRPIRPASTNVKQTHEIYSKNDKWDPDSTMVVLPTNTRARVNALVRTLPPISDATTKETMDWYRILEQGFYMGTNGWFEGAVERPGSQYVQYLQGERGPLGLARPKMEQFNGAKLTGDRALRRVYASIGIGDQLTFPLYHSGYWITLRAPTEAELIELEHRLTDTKVLLGRRTSGAIFSNQSAMMCADLMTFVEEHHYDNTLVEKDNWRKHLDVRDFPHLIWGMACTIWPAGFQYIRAVTGNTSRDDKLIRENLALSKLQWTDSSVFTDWQISHMSKRASSSMSEADIARYKSEFSIGLKARNTIDLGNDVKIVLDIPTVDKHINAGQRWIDGIVVATDRVFGMDQDEEERNKYIMDQARASLMREFSHWVKSIEIGTDVIESEEDINNSLAVYSQIDAMRDKYVEGIQKYMDDMMISVIAVTTNEPDETNVLPRFPHLLPIDPMSTFFILLSQKIRQIQAR